MKWPKPWSPVDCLSWTNPMKRIHFCEASRAQGTWCPAGFHRRKVAGHCTCADGLKGSKHAMTNTLILVYIYVCQSINIHEHMGISSAIMGIWNMFLRPARCGSLEFIRVAVSSSCSRPQPRAPDLRRPCRLRSGVCSWRPQCPRQRECQIDGMRE